MLKRTNGERLLCKTLAGQLLRKLHMRRFGGAAGAKAPKEAAKIKKIIDISSLRPDGSELDGLFAAAKRYMRHEFNLLGSGWVCVNRTDGGDGYRPIDWQRDFKSGYLFAPDVPSAALEQSVFPEGVDIKWPWELSRMQHLPQLALAAVCQEEKAGVYLKEFINQVEDFTQNNPMGRGVNWACTMDVALRAISLLISYDIFSQISSFDDDFSAWFSRLMQQYARFIASHLEKNFTEDKSGNHYLSDLAGLLMLGIYLDNAEMRRYFRFAKREYLREIEKQYFCDGGIYEFSTAYQRLDGELTALAVSAVLHDSGVSAGVALRLSRSLDFLNAIIGPDGAIVQIGDNDSGHALIMLPGTKKLDESLQEDALSPGPAVFMTQALFGMPGALARPEARVVKALCAGHFLSYIEKECVNAGPCHPEPPPKELIYEQKTQILMDVPESLEAEVFPDFGLAVLSGKDFRLYFRIPTNLSKGKSIHAHEDFLHFEIAAPGFRVFADQGSYAYSPDLPKRNLFRSAAAHNVPRYEAPQLEIQGCWQATPKADGGLVYIDEKNIVAQMRLGPILHQRELRVSRGGIAVTDRSNAAFSGGCSEFSYRSVGYGYIEANCASSAAGYPEIRQEPVRRKNTKILKQGEKEK